MSLGGFHAGGRRPTASETNNNKGAKEMAVEIKHIIKRDGSVKDFDAQKIAYAIECAGKATNQFGRERAEEITETLVMPRLRQLSVATPHIEQVQDAVEHALYEAGYFETLRAYIVYREQRARSRDAKKSWVDVESSINEYLNQSDWRVNANANQGYSLGGLILNVSGKVIANYWLNYIYTPEIGQCHRQADFHIHDLDMLSGYCAGWSLRTLLQEGFNGVPGKVEAGAPKHFSSATGQIVNFLGTMQNEWAGAQAFSSFDTYMAPFIRKDNTPYEEVLQGIQELIYNLNVPSRWGTQTPFTNLTFDWTCPEDLKNVHPLIGGEEMPFTYGELQKEMDMINRAYIEVMTKGDAKGRVFTFPIPTYNITPDFDWDSPNVLPLFDMTARYGLPYFQNFINSELKPNMIRSMCCRLQLDLRELLKRGNGLFGSAEQTGSLGVVTINCARLGYLFKGSEEALFARLDHLLELARDSLEIKRKTIQKHIDQGLFPYTKRYLGTLRNHFSTIGVNGLNEMIRNFTDDAEDITTEKGTTWPCVCSITSARAWLNSRPKRATCTTWKRRLPKARRIASQRKTRSVSRTFCRPERRSIRTTRTLLSCLWVTPTIRSKLLKCRKTCSASTPAAPCFIST